MSTDHHPNAIGPVRCFTCNKVMGNKYDQYQTLLTEGKTPIDALNELKLVRYCCRRMIFTNVDLTDMLIAYSAKKD